MSAGLLDIFYECGIPDPIEIDFEDNARNPLDLTPYTARLQIRAYDDSSTVIQTLDTADGTIVLTATKFNITLYPPATIPQGRYAYDLVLYLDGVPTDKVVKGEWFADPIVTLPAPPAP